MGSIFTHGVKLPRKLFVLQQHHANFSIPVRCNMKILIGVFSYIAVFFVVGLRRRNIFEKTAKSGVSNSQVTKTTERATEMCATQRIV